MTITNRLTLYFQLALGLVLLGFSLALYLLASWHLHAQADRHLQAAMDLLVAAIEVHPSDVEWEPLERKLTLGDSADPEAVRWTLHDESGQLVDCSANTADTAWPDNRESWRLLVCQINSGDFKPKLIDPRSRSVRTVKLTPLPPNRSAKRSTFVLAVGLANAPIHTELLSLGIALAGVSLTAWIIAGLCARSLCRRALRPVHQMAQTARQLQMLPNSEALLTVPSNNDELADLSNAFNGLLGTLRESIERQARFAGDASHQLRTPLTATQTAVDVALRRARSIEEYQRVLTIVQRRSQELTNIVETLLTLARHPDETTRTRLAFDVIQCCRERIDAMSHHERATDLHLHCEQDPVCVHSDPVLVAQIIDNLLDNALKYSKPGTPVTIRAWANSYEAVVCVTDEGDGIAAQELSQVFEPFFRSPQARWNGCPGIGLGLAIASRFAELAGGRLEVKSEESAGSEFRLALPVHNLLLAITPSDAIQDEKR